MKILIVFSALLISINCYAQHKYWNRDSLITWNDFKGPVDPNAKFDAMTISTFTYEYHLDKVNGDNIAVCTAESSFNCDKSWSVSTKRNALLLSHEQLHFDITEYFARQFQTIVNTRKFSDTARKEIRAIFLQLDARQRALQLLYDDETNHGAIPPMQKQWQDFITGMLDKNTPLAVMIENVPK